MSDEQNQIEVPEVDEEEEFGLSDFLGEEFEEEDDDFLPEVAIDQVITLRSTNTGSTYVPADEPMPLQAVLAESGLTIGANCIFYVESTQVPLDAVIQPGTTVLIVGNVKGGAL